MIEKKHPSTALPPIVSRDEWRAARKALLAKEKAATRLRDSVSAERRRLPMVKIEEELIHFSARRSVLSTFRSAQSVAP